MKFCQYHSKKGFAPVPVPPLAEGTGFLSKKHRESRLLNREGFTLIELIVAFGIFFIVAGSASWLFVEAVKAQKRTLAYQQVLDNVSYVMEYMSRTLRMAKKDTDGGCITPTNGWVNYEDIGNGIRFLNYRGYCQEFYLQEIGQEKRLVERKSTDKTFGNLGLPVALTSSQITVARFGIYDWGWAQGVSPEYENLQPKVTIFLESKELLEGVPLVRIQTSVSQRNLDIEK